MADAQSGICIREGRPGDLEVLHRLIRALARYERMEHRVRVRLEDLRAFGTGEQPYFNFLLAEHGPEAVGFALYFYTFSTFEGRPTLFLEDLFVLKEWRRRGVGQALMTTLAREALKRGCARMEWMVLDWNQSGQAFFQTLGATPVPEWRLYRMEEKEIAWLAAQHSEADPPKNLLK